MNKTFFRSAVLVMACLIFGCAGSLRYSKADPEAANFKPGSIAILPVNVGPYADAAGLIDGIIADALAGTGRYSVVLAPEQVREKAVDETSRAMLADYLAKLEIVNFSDPDLSIRIGETIGVDAFLVTALSFWSYTVDPRGKDIAKVGLEMRLVEVSTGKILWTAHHFDEKRYSVFKPELADVGRSVAKRMIQEMPR